MACSLMVMTCVCVLAGCTTAVPPHRAPAAVGPDRTALSFPQLEGVYRQDGRAFVVTYQGWWLDLTSQQIRQLTPAGGARSRTGRAGRTRRPPTVSCGSAPTRPGSRSG